MNATGFHMTSMNCRVRVCVSPQLASSSKQLRASRTASRSCVRQPLRLQSAVSRSPAHSLHGTKERRPVACHARRRRGKRVSRDDGMGAEEESAQTGSPEEPPEEAAEPVAEPEPEPEPEPQPQPVSASEAPADVAAEAAPAAEVEDEAQAEPEEEVIEGGPIDWDAEWELEEEAASQDTTQLKAALLDTFLGTERGLSAASNTRAEVMELITRLEAANPTPTPTQELDLLSGTWKLAYTTNSELSLLLAGSKLPFVSIGDVTQTIDAASKTVENCLEVQTPLSKQRLMATAAFEVRSPKRLQVVFNEGSIATPQLVDDLDIPSTFSLGGQDIDTAPLKGVLAQVKAAVEPAVAFLSEQPDLKFDITNDKAQSWLVTTFLDQDLRIARGDGGSIFVLTKAFAV